MSVIKERLTEFLTYKGIGQIKFAEAAGLSRGFVNVLGDGISSKSLNKISQAFPELNTLWLTTGEGEMLKTTNNTPQYNEATPIQQDVVYIPLVNQFAYAGYLDGYTDTTYMEQLPKIPFIVDKEGHGNYIAFEVKGDSMNNGTEESYLEGDRLYCREIQPHLWVSSKLHLRKWDFVIVHTDGIIVKAHYRS